MPEQPLSLSERRRRVLIICCNYMRSLAIYRPIFQVQKKLCAQSPTNVSLWSQIANNALDICVLDWCKILGDPKSSKHYYTHVLSLENQTSFQRKLFIEQNISADEHNTFTREMRSYRDKLVAHLDDGRVMDIPRLDIASSSISLLYSALIEKECDHRVLEGLPPTSAGFKDCYDAHARQTNALIRQVVGE